MKNKAFLASFNILNKVFLEGAYSQIALNNYLQNANEEDKPLVTKIVYGVLQNNLQLEYYLKQFYTKKPKNAPTIILKIGAFCHLYLNSIPNYALVNELVELGKLKAKRGEVGFLNGVLKNIVKTSLVLPSEKDELNYLSVKYSYPLWLLKSLKKDYGKLVLNKLLTSEKYNKKHIRINLNKTTKADFLTMLNKYNIEYEKSVLEDALFIDYKKLLNIDELKGFYAVQSLGSMLIVNSLKLKDSSNVLDVCSAPGGKTCYMAQQNKSGKVLALDIHNHRLDLINKYAENMGLTNIKTYKNDASVFNEKLQNKFDYVLCDAPCSGIGTINKKPDILLFRKEESIVKLANLQLKILTNSSKYVKQGGIIVYSTCTLLKKENSEVVNKFLNQNKNFILEKIEVETVENITENNMVTLLPNKLGAEGFFIAKLKRI